MQRSWLKRWWYDGLRVLCRTFAVVLFRIRCFGRDRAPATGGALVLANHQSHLDPVFVGMAFNRRLSYLARDSLFGFPPFRWLINSLDAIPIDREGLGLSGLKETLRRLKRGELVLMFPEGTRTPDGDLQPFRPGFCAVARRAGVPLLPVAVDGAFAAWPRTRRFPRPAAVRVCLAPPLLPEEIARLSDEKLTEQIAVRLRAAFEFARNHLRAD
jgi:1-acyl-sn-glycerol-3-phosphate acyltransferase